MCTILLTWVLLMQAVLITEFNKKGAHWQSAGTAAGGRGQQQPERSASSAEQQQRQQGAGGGEPRLIDVLCLCQPEGQGEAEAPQGATEVAREQAEKDDKEEECVEGVGTARECHSPTLVLALTRYRGSIFVWEERRVKGFADELLTGCWPDCPRSEVRGCRRPRGGQDLPAMDVRVR
jgi:hypothetical protein